MTQASHSSNVTVSVIGCGLIGQRRSENLPENCKITQVMDIDQGRANALALKLGVPARTDLGEVLQSPTDIAIIAVPHNMLFSTAEQCLKSKINLLLEKPGGICVDELDRLKKISHDNQVAVKVGFNHRFHPAILKAKSLVRENAIGELLFARAHYGHGARVGYENEWRCRPELSGGGELIDQGVHLLDLSFSFFGPLPLKSSYVTTSYWNTPVDDNAVLTLADSKYWASISVSMTEWKNQFWIELYGRTGKIRIEGLGRSYGPEKLTLYQMPAEMGPPNATEFDFSSAPDFSWEWDMQNLLDHISQNTPLLGDLESAKYCLVQVREAYRTNGYGHLPCSV